MAHNGLQRPSLGEECDYMQDERARLRAGAQKHFAQRAGGSADAITRDSGKRGAQPGSGKRLPSAGMSDED